MRLNRGDPIFDVQGRKRHGIPPFVMIILILLIIAFMFNMFNNQRIQVVEQSVTVPNLPSALEGYKILHISDLHGTYFGKDQASLAATLSGVKYNMVCISGDMCASNGDFTAFIKLLQLLNPDVPIYFVPGDEDPSPVISVPHALNNALAEYILAAQKLGAVYLNAPEKIKVGSATLWICPDSYFSTDISGSRHSLNSRRDMLLNQPQTAETEAALKAIDVYLDALDRCEQAQLSIVPSDITIALSHIPYTAQSVTELPLTDTAADFANLSLVLAGHYNNGQFRLPLLGALFVPDSIAKNAPSLSGLSSIRGIQQYVSPGLGTASIYPLPVRFCNTPSISVIKLTSKLTQ